MAGGSGILRREAPRLPFAVFEDDTRVEPQLVLVRLIPSGDDHHIAEILRPNVGWLLLVAIDEVHVVRDRLGIVARPYLDRLGVEIGQRAHVVLIDESGFFLNPMVRRTWAPRGGRRR